MWRVSVIVLLALSATALSVRHRSSIREKLLSYRVKSQNIHIDHLEHDIDELENSLDHLSRPLSKWDINMLVTRVDNNEGKQSKKHRHPLNLHVNVMYIKILYRTVIYIFIFIHHLC